MVLHSVRNVERRSREGHHQFQMREGMLTQPVNP